MLLAAIAVKLALASHAQLTLPLQAFQRVHVSVVRLVHLLSKTKCASGNLWLEQQGVPVLQSKGSKRVMACHARLIAGSNPAVLDLLVEPILS